MKEFQLCQRSTSDADLFFFLKKALVKNEKMVFFLGGEPKVHIQQNS